MGEDKTTGLVPGERHASWFPLAALGFVLIALVASALSGDRGWFSYSYAGFSDQTSLTFAYKSTRQYGDYLLTPSVGRSVVWIGYWQVAVVIAFLLTVLWYALRARRAGAPIRAWRLVLVTMGGLAVVAAGAALQVVEAVEPSLVGPVTAVIGLSALAWLERSGLLVAITVLSALAALGFAPGVLGLLVPAAVLLAGAMAVLVTARRPTAPPAGA